MCWIAIRIQSQNTVNLPSRDGLVERALNAVASSPRLVQQLLLGESTPNKCWGHMDEFDENCCLVMSQHLRKMIQIGQRIPGWRRVARRPPTTLLQLPPCSKTHQRRPSPPRICFLQARRWCCSVSPAPSLPAAR